MIYLDHNATAPRRPEVFAAMRPFLIERWGKLFGREESINNGLTLWLGRRIAVMEFLVGFATDADAEPYLRGFVVLPIDSVVLDETARVMRELCRAGQSIGAADSIISATARLYGLPLVTDNTRHFKRVPGLDVHGYLPLT